jgi:two-component sensor histidine kinase
LLEQKAVLAAELKSRVRNNLQLIYGMLARDLTMRSGAEEKASTYGIMRRVMTLAEVYEQLLGTGLGRTADLGAYLKAICANLPGLQAQPRSKISLTCVVESVPVSLDTTTAIGMVVAELVANSYEHAFPSSASGAIIVSLRRSEASAKEAILTVSDNGTGFIERPGSKRHGVGLVRRLMQQVQGSADMQSGSGTKWTLWFPVGGVDS